MNLRKKKGFHVLSFLMAFVLVMMEISVSFSPQKAEAKSSKKVVVLYFSGTGTTKAVAKKIKKSTGGKLIAIQAQQPYTSADLDWTDSNSRVVQEHESASSPANSSVRPAVKNLAAIKKAVKTADVVYIGYPKMEYGISLCI
jgi:3-deoxy-D-arabino-heptulosonate 7-phosphate (DAHP) synthase